MTLDLVVVEAGSVVAEVETAGFAATVGDPNFPVLAVVGTETFPGMAEATARVAHHG